MWLIESSQLKLDQDRDFLDGGATAELRFSLLEPITPSEGIVTIKWRLAGDFGEIKPEYFNPNVAKEKQMTVKYGE